MTRMADADKDALHLRWQALKTEREPWITECKAISDALLTRTSRALYNDTERKDRRRNTIYDNSALMAQRTLSSGMMAGATSPARPWFRLSTPDSDLNKSRNVKVWLADVTELMQRIFNRSNTYAMLAHSYREHASFGMAASIVAADYDNVIHHTPLTAGAYAVATDHRGYVNTLYREMTHSVSEVVGKFGRDKVSQSVRNLYDLGHLDKPVTYMHAIEPRSDRDSTKRDAANMAWRSTYFEPGAPKGQYLRDSGFKRFRALVSRWDLVGDDVYGCGPGLDALGDIRGLQHMQLRKAQIIDKITDPALNVPASLKSKSVVDARAGATNFVDVGGQNKGIHPVHTPTIDLQHLLMDIGDSRDRIRRAFYADLFLMLSNQPAGGSKMTAAEVAERHEEKLLMLGPVLERLHSEHLDPMIENTFDLMVEADMIPPAPEEMQGAPLNVEFVSMLAQAQRAVGINATDRFVSSLGIVEAMKPGTLDKFDSDHWVDAYSDILGVDPEMIVASDRVALIRDERAKRQQQAEAMAAAQAQADTAHKLAGADTSGSNALTDVMSGLTGYTTPTGA